jgi:competence protein ComEA
MGSIQRVLAIAAAGTLLIAASGQQPAPKPLRAPGALVDINHASIGELLKVPGMTQTWAARIVRFRPYRAKNDLLDRGVVTNEVYGRIKASIVAHREKQ